jgi:hypothetical protein
MVAGCCLLATAAGCWTFTIEHRQTANKPFLPPLVPPKDAIQLEVFPIERAAGDPLMGETLWRQLDEMGAVSSQETRGRLRSAGLRVGSAGSNPPQTLRAAATAERTGGESSGRPVQVPLLAGQETVLETVKIEEEFVLRSSGVGGEVSRSYAGARCVLRVTGERIQEGWVRLSFQPEVHYGPAHIKRTAGDGAWKLQEGQKIDRFFEQRFEVELHVGELVVIGAGDAPEDSIGARFFRTGTPPSATERVLVVRVDDLQQIEPVRAE